MTETRVFIRNLQNGQAGRRRLRGYKTTQMVRWIPTKADGQFEVLFRFCGPEKPLFDKTWKLPDIEKAQQANRLVF